MEKILSGDDKIRRAEEIYYRRRMGAPNSRFSKIEGEKKSYLGSKIILEVLIIINLSIIIMCVQNKNYIFTENFLADIQNYNVNITQNIKEFIGIDTTQDNNVQNNVQNIVNTDEQIVQNTQDVTNKTITEEIVPNEEGQASSLNQMEEDISKIKQLVAIQKPINEGTVTSRFGTRTSFNKNVEGYHTGIDIGAAKGTSIYAATSRNSKFSI